MCISTSLAILNIYYWYKFIMMYVNAFLNLHITHNRLAAHEFKLLMNIFNNIVHVFISV